MFLCLNLRIIFLFISILINFSLIFVQSSTLNIQKDLEIIVEEKPDHCDVFASIGDTVGVDFTAMLNDGRIFDSSLQEGRSPIRFQIGAGKLIIGWERGVQGMCVGEKRKLIIPPHLAYGVNGVDGVIPPNAALYFQVHLAELERPSIINQLHNAVNFSVWPIGLATLVYYLYNKINAAIEEEEKTANRKSSRKKR